MSALCGGFNRSTHAGEADRRAWRWRVAHKLALQWSPEQIAGWLKRQLPTDQGMQISHETIYRSLFIQTRGVLKKQLMAHLRTARGKEMADHKSFTVATNVQVYFCDPHSPWPRSRSGAAAAAVCAPVW